MAYSFIYLAEKKVFVTSGHDWLEPKEENLRMLRREIVKQLY